ncbi:SsrA-binding protein SmpB [bacterium]|nr:SsrA-binding protein SmpB [bacterium]
MKKAEVHAGKYLVGNRRAFHLYQVLEKHEAGIELKGCEVKSLRAGTANLMDSFAAVKEGQLWLMNMHIAPYAQGNRENTDPMRSRRLLMHKREINRLAGSISQKGLTLIPLGLYLQGRRVKVELGLARGKHTYDKKQALKERDISRETERAVRGREKGE